MIKVSVNSHETNCMVCQPGPSFIFLIDFSHFDPEKFQSEVIASYVSCHKESVECVLKTGHLCLYPAQTVFIPSKSRFFSLNKRRALKKQESQQGSFEVLCPCIISLFTLFCILFLLIMIFQVYGHSTLPSEKAIEKHGHASCKFRAYSMFLYKN